MCAKWKNKRSLNHDSWHLQFVNENVLIILNFDAIHITNVFPNVISTLTSHNSQLILTKLNLMKSFVCLIV